MEQQKTTHDGGNDAAATTNPTYSEQEGADPPNGFDPPTLVEIKNRPDAKLPNPFGIIVWAFCTLFAFGYGIYDLVREGVFVGIVLMLGAFVSVYYVGRGLRLRRAVEEAKETNAQTPSTGGGAVATTSVTPPVQPTSSQPPKPSGTLVIEAVERPVAVIPAPKALAPARWLMVRRADGFQLTFVMPDLPANQGWWFSWGGFYLRRDQRGFYACVGHPDDRMSVDDLHRLFEEVQVRVGDYALTVTASEPNLPS